MLINTSLQYPSLPAGWVITSELCVCPSAAIPPDGGGGGTAVEREEVMCVGGLGTAAMEPPSTYKQENTRTVTANNMHSHTTQKKFILLLTSPYRYVYIYTLDLSYVYLRTSSYLTYTILPFSNLKCIIRSKGIWYMC